MNPQVWKPDKIQNEMNQTIFPYPIKRIGIIGGGQLGKMTAQAAKQMGFYVTVLDPTPKCPAAHLANAQIMGSLYDVKKLRMLANASEVLTYEIEHIDTQTLKILSEEGYTIYPSPNVLEIIQDKLKQKQVLAQNGVPVPHFEAIDELTVDVLTNVRYPIVQKARKGGYDGKGVVVLKSQDDVKNALTIPSLLEEFIDFTKELAIIIVRTPTGDVACYPIVEMVFDDKTNICDIVAVPAKIDSVTAEQARQVALHAIEVLDGVGVFGVEMFLTHDGQILINEIAPRPHNSGHYTIEACMTSQFEQLVRVISGLPLGSSDLLKPAAMLNLLGEEGYSGQPLIEGLKETLAIPGLSFHWYDKTSTRPFRKMGHITILDDDLDNALNKVDQVKNIFKIKAR